MSNSLEKYIYEQIFVLEQKQVLQENKVLKGLTTLGLAAAVFFASNYLQKDDIQPKDVSAKAASSQVGSKLSPSQRAQIKKGAQLAKSLINQGRHPKIITQHGNDPSIAQALKTLFMNPGQATDLEKESGERLPVASIEGFNVNDYFVYSREELEQYFNKEANRSILALEDGSNILDMTPEELNQEISDPTSEVVKVIAEEFLMSAMVEQNVTNSIVEAFLSNDKDTMEENMDVAEIKAQHEPEMLRVKALKHWLKSNIKSPEALRTLKDLSHASGGISSQEEIDNWLKRYTSGEMPSEFTGRFDDKKQRDRSSDYKDITDFLQ